MLHISSQMSIRWKVYQIATNYFITYFLFFFTSIFSELFANWFTSLTSNCNIVPVHCAIILNKVTLVFHCNLIQSKNTYISRYMQVFRISKIARLAESCIIWTRGSIFAKYSLQKKSVNWIYQFTNYPKNFIYMWKKIMVILKTGNK